MPCLYSRATEIIIYMTSKELCGGETVSGLSLIPYWQYHTTVRRLGFYNFWPASVPKSSQYVYESTVWQIFSALQTQTSVFCCVLRECDNPQGQTDDRHVSPNRGRLAKVWWRSKGSSFLGTVSEIWYYEHFHTVGAT